MPTNSSTSPPIQNNIALAVIFHRMADCYRYLGNQVRFRAIAYENISKILYNMKDDIATYATNVQSLDAIGGIGESIAKKIIEFLKTGGIKTFEQLKTQVPYKLVELMDITGFGPATLKLLHDTMGVNNKEDLVKILADEKLTGLKGFGEKKIENLKRALKIFKPAERMPFGEAKKIANAILDAIINIPGVQKAAIAGSLRRKKATIGDIDIVVMAEPKYRKQIAAKFSSLQVVNKVLAKGNTKVSVLLKPANVQVDVRIVSPYEYGAALLYFTGSKEHNIKLRTIARNRGYKINEYGLFKTGTHRRIAGATEEELYHALHMQYIPPEERLDKGEIEKAMAG
jgi:DNA polymerase (family X)